MSSFSLRIVLLIAALALAATTTARAQQNIDGDAGSKVLALERLWGQAAHLRDIKALDAIFDDDFVNLDIDGRLMTKAQTLADTLTAGPVEIVVESTGAQVHGDVVVVTGVLHLKGVDHGKPYLRRGRFADTWLKKNAHWVCISSETTPMEQR
jgi:ketosteroid isomerase-like protein